MMAEPLVLLKKIPPVTCRRPPLLLLSPPEELWLKVVSTTRSDPWLSTTPWMLKSFLLWLMVLPVTVKVPKFAMAPPPWPTFSLMIVLATSSTPKLKIAPPLELDVLPLRALLVRVSTPELAIPAPLEVDVLPLMIVRESRVTRPPSRIPKI
jgi:hypothetical protein